MMCDFLDAFNHFREGLRPAKCNLTDHRRNLQLHTNEQTTHWILCFRAYFRGASERFDRVGLKH